MTRRPRPPGRGGLGWQLNPEAGSHPIPADPREIEAALRAGESSWRRFPYYEQRYGERGRGFTRSDSAWLVTLCDGDEAAAHEQLAWLGRVLAARGMPRWLLELHLRVLHDELMHAVPERTSAYRTLLVGAEGLAAERRSHLGDDALRVFTSAFDARVPPEWSAGLPETGALLSAAVADERAGVENAVESLSDWLQDAARVPEEWIAAVRATLCEARAHVSRPDSAGGPR
jgi:hypothetical protein